MNPYERRPMLGGIFQRNAWLLPLLLGIGIGALFFGLPGNDRGHRFERRASYGPTLQLPQQRNDHAQQPAAPVVPEHAAPHGRHMGQGFGERFGERHDRGFGFGFFPFGLSRLIIPALLIGAGLWFLRGSRGGNGWGGPGQSYTQPVQGTPPYTPPAAGPEAAAPGTTDPPSTSETRRL